MENEQRHTFTLESCGMAQTPGSFGGTVTSQTPYASFFIGTFILFHPSVTAIVSETTELYFEK